MAYLDDHAPKRAQQRKPRRQRLSGVIVVHTAESAPDTSGPDSGAENVARFISNRTDAAGSYHDVVDADSFVNVVSYDSEAFHDGTGTNRHSLGLSFATQAARWRDVPEVWVEGAIGQAAWRAAAMAHHVHAQTGIVIPARRINATQAHACIPGFVTHGELDPGRRSDPGADFPWDRFLPLYDYLTAGLRGGPTPAPQPAPAPAPGVDWAALRRVEEMVASKPTIKQGSTGQAVRELWAFLEGSGIRQAGMRDATPPWRFGPATGKAVRTYQKSRGLTVDGVVGSKTWTKLVWEAIGRLG